MPSNEQSQALVEAYLDGWKTSNKQAWLALFADDAALVDPVGTPAHVGKAAIGAFWDTVKSTGMAMQPELHRLVTCGDEVLAAFTMTSTAAGGVGMAVNIIDVFTVNEAGLITELKAYWDNSCMRMVSATSDHGTAT